MPFSRPKIRNTGWKAKVILGYVLIILLFCTTSAWTLFITVTNATEDNHHRDMETFTHSVKVSIEASTNDSVAALLDRLSETTPYIIELRDNDGSSIAYSDRGAQTYSSTQKDRSQVTHFNPFSFGSTLTEDVTVTSDTDSVTQEVQAFDSSSEEVLSVEQPVTFNGTTVQLVVSEPLSTMSDRVASTQVFGFGLLLTSLLLACLLSYWSYSAALNSAERVERMLTSFMANSSHEMKTPIASIKLLAESIVIAVRRGKTDKVEDFAERIEATSDHLEKLVRNMLSTTRNANDTTKSNALIGGDRTAGICIASHIVEQSVDLQEPLAHEKNLAVNVRCSQEAKSARVTMPGDDLLAVMNNLLGNAISYTHEGRIDIALITNGSDVVILISDTGCGISKSDQKRIFERFYRVDTTRINHPQGTGLGLSVARNLVESAGGSLSLESQPGTGSTFAVRIPLASEKQGRKHIGSTRV